MASSDDDLLNAVQENYLEALRNEPNDLAAATTIDQIKQIQDNVAKAKSAYFEALAAQLAADKDGVTQAYGELMQALQTEKECRKNASAIPDILGKLKQATDAVQKLIALAAK
jgi:hypothetical protein